MSTAAAWSTTALREAPFLPRSRSIASADTVVRRSSCRRTGTGADSAGERACELPHPRGRRTLASGQRARQPDHDLDRLGLDGQARDPGQVAAAPAHGLDRGRQEPGRVAPGDPDPGVPGVEAESYAGAHRAQAAPAAPATAA